MRRLLLELYLTSTLTVLLVGILIGRLSYAPTAVPAAGEVSATSSPQAKPAPTAEERLARRVFRANCASCHAADLKTNLTGPALAGAPARWADYPADDLRAWIRNAPALVAAGHPRAEELVADYDGVVMPAFPQLADAEVEALIGWLEE